MTDEEELFHLRKDVVELRHKLALAMRHRDGHHVEDEPTDAAKAETDAIEHPARKHG